MHSGFLISQGFSEGLAYEPPWQSLLYLNAKHIDHIAVRAAELDSPIGGGGGRTAVAEDINVGKGHVHGHRAELVPAAVEGKDISNLVTMVAAMVSFLFYQGEFDFWFHPCHLLFQSAK